MPWGFLILLAAGLLLGWLLLVGFTVWLLTHPPRRSYAHAVARNLPGDPSEITVVGPDGTSQRGLAFSEWSFASRGINLPVWDVQGLSRSGPTIILTHGWGDSRVVMLPRVAALASLASRMILWDLPAHGDAPSGTFTLGTREHEDLLALVDTLALKPGAGPSPLVLHGFSLGAGTSIVAAALLAQRGTHHFSGVIVESPYRIPPVPARNVLRVRAMPYRTNLLPAMAVLGLRFARTLGWAISPTAAGFDRVLHAGTLSRELPLLVLHGSNDPICPVNDGRAIAAAAPNSTVAIIEGGGHNNLWTEPALAARSLGAVREFLARV